MRELVLIVDDNPVNAKLERVLLEKAGYEVAVAPDAHAALDVLTGRLPALILMDLQLPGMDGFTLTRRLRQDPATAALPIVAVTAYAMNGDEARALESGCNGYLTKPINTRTFVAQVVGFIAGAGAGSAAIP